MKRALGKDALGEDALFLGADTGGTKVKFVVADAAAEPRIQAEVATDPADPERTLKALAKELRERLGRRMSDIQAVGLACAGIVSPTSGWLGRSPNLPGWENRDLRAVTQSAFPGLPVVLANDVNAALYGEYRFGAGRGCRHLMMIALGTGVGGGVLIDGELLTGSTDGAGEIGHMTLATRGPRCSCGRLGCLEAYAGSVALLRRARELAARPESSTEEFRRQVKGLGTQLSTRALYAMAATGDPSATKLFAAAGRRLGQAVANLVNVLNPDRVIIGGGVAQAGEVLLDPCRAVVAAHVLAEEARRTPIVPAELGPYAAALGVAALAREMEI